VTKHETFVVEHAYEVPPGVVFRAFADPSAKARWSLGSQDWQPRYELEFRVGGRELYRGGPPGGAEHRVSARYLDIEPDSRIVYAYDVLVGPARVLASLATIELVARDGGTLLVYTEQSAFFDHSAPASFREHMGNVLDALEAELSGQRPSGSATRETPTAAG
jgi:uncharacterized protein YndB with AHSA1/START domain